MKKEILKFFVLLVVAIGAGPAAGAFWNWSKTASNNGNSDPSISWVEGMPPSVVNDSGRAMMARLAEQFADTSGSLVTAGGPTAYTVTTNQGFPNPPVDGQTVGVTFNVASSGSPTLAVDGGSATPIVTAPGSPASVTNGVPYTLLYNAASTSWIVRGGAGGGGIPLGGVVPYTGTTVPSASYVFANGQCISTATYATYWALVGSPAPGSCSAGNFAVIDLRGRSLAGIDNMGGASAAGRLTSSANGCGTAMTSVGAVCANGNESRALTLVQMPPHFHNIPFNDPGHIHTLPYTFGGTAAGSPGLSGVGAFGSVSTDSDPTGITFNSPNGANTTYSAGGSAGAVVPHPIVQPTIGINYIIRVL
jgi:microcystin-dependent protein